MAACTRGICIPKWYGDRTDTYSKGNKDRDGETTTIQNLKIDLSVDICSST